MVQLHPSKGLPLYADWLETDAVSAIEPRTSRVLLRRLNVPGHVYISLRFRAELILAICERLSVFDILALPTTPITAPLAAPLVRDADLADRTELQLLRYPYIANQFGLKRSRCRCRG